MTAAERKIRFDVALEMVQRVYGDYCRDQSKTREQAYEFCCFVNDMIKFSSTLGEEAEKVDTCPNCGATMDLPEGES